MPTPSKDAILIAGPTASGKSALAIAIAKKCSGEIVNADAIQVYRDLRILSARPTTEEMAGVAHHLFGHVAGSERYSSGIWAEDVASVISDINARGNTPVIVGGTGLYFKALTHGLSAIPDVPVQIRNAVLEEFNGIGISEFRVRLLKVDPAMERLEPADTQRHLRAYEVFKATGRPLSEFQSAPGQPILKSARVRVILAPEREVLYQRCEERFDNMMTEGALDEARSLKQSNFDAALPVMKALGAAELIAHLEGKLSQDEAVDLAKRNTRRFAKRQMTWFRNQNPDWPQFEDASLALDYLMAEFNIQNTAAR